MLAFSLDSLGFQSQEVHKDNTEENREGKSRDEFGC
jgi:hypothetical protein